MRDKTAEVILGVGGILGHDANAALLVDGKLIGASQEERYTRRKHDERFPAHAIRDCLSAAGCAIDDIDVCVFGDKFLQEWLATQTDRPSNWLMWHLGRLIPEQSLGPLEDARRDAHNPISVCLAPSVSRCAGVCDVAFRARGLSLR